MKKAIVYYVLGFMAATGIAYAITVNPASNALADSANTALTIIYRDATGTIEGLKFSTGFVPAVKTKAQFDALTPTAVGQTYLCSDCTIIYQLCVSTSGTHISDFKASHSATVGCGSGN